MAIKESALAAITSITQSDFVRAVTAAGASRRITVANLAKAIIEGYTGSSLAGSAQSVKSALDSLNSKATFYELGSTESLLDIANNDTICPVSTAKYVNTRYGNTPNIPTQFGVACVIKRASGVFSIVLFADSGRIYIIGHTSNSAGYGEWKQLAFTS